MLTDSIQDSDPWLPIAKQQNVLAETIFLSAVHLLR